MTPLIAITASYLVGSIPFGLLAGRLRGIDIRKHGSGNIGATNVLRTLGKPIGITVLILDVLKGFTPVVAAAYLLPKPQGDAQQLILMSCAIATICGHNYPIWLKFKGGKGIATSAGALLALFPIPLAIALGVWILVFFLSKYVSLASIVAAISIPLTLATMRAPLPSLLFTIALAGLATWRHRPNIQRLIAGTENRFERRKKEPDA